MSKLSNFKNASLKHTTQQSIRGGKNKFQNLLSTHMNLAIAKQSGNAGDIAHHQNALDCLGFASTNNNGGNGLGVW